MAILSLMIFLCRRIIRVRNDPFSAGILIRTWYRFHPSLPTYLNQWVPFCHIWGGSTWKNTLGWVLRKFRASIHRREMREAPSDSEIRSPRKVKRCVRRVLLTASSAAALPRRSGFWILLGKRRVPDILDRSDAVFRECSSMR